MSAETDGVEQSTGVFGYLNAKGEWAIPAQYEEGYAFSDGLAAVVKDGAVQFIDKTGKTVLETDYDDVGDFSEGLAAFEQDGKYGYINKKGRCRHRADLRSGGCLQRRIGVRHQGRMGRLDQREGRVRREEGLCSARRN
ncbi:WG repeat-containing protein [Cohnella ginsengisoli]|uniref:WG repeat-containing protein n=1 Tax=Cohnella ginsengisoli TaxID=425004 RepID=A0A9X4KLT0_9BACL|nr:WG repeat-containing protein [Cohnella ginsengisoli]MDG0792797.1 WG repeat-containing protein [Cohnella ginsengisoli]